MAIGLDFGTGSGISKNIQQSQYAGFLQGLTKPITTPYKSQFQERANLLREYTQGAYETAGEQMRTHMGGKGLRAGESGIADVPLAGIARAGAQELSKGYRGLATEEARLEQQYKMGTEGLELQRLLGGGQLALTGEEGALNRMMEYYRAQLGAETAQFQPWWQGLSSGY